MRVIAASKESASRAGGAKGSSLRYAGRDGGTEGRRDGGRGEMSRRKGARVGKFPACRRRVRVLPEKRLLVKTC